MRFRDSHLHAQGGRGEPSAARRGPIDSGAAVGQVLVITCEHGGNRIPAAYRDLFTDHQALLATHCGFDRGALVMARALAKAFAAPLVYSETSRLLVDLNRSKGHPRLHHAVVQDAPGAVRQEVLANYYEPYRREAERAVMTAIEAGRQVIHVSSHSFTPVLDGKVRTADIGLLYDPARAGERALCARWKAALEARAPEYVVRRNYPYAGKGDGLTAWFRKRLPAERYVGVELEVNQKLVEGPEHRWHGLRQTIVESLRDAVGAFAAEVRS